MRFLHTADWHLGRILGGVDLTEDQAHALDGLVRFARDARLDAIVIAGDIYDRAVPPPGAVGLLDDTLSRLTLDVGVPVVLIAGNHDSARRLDFGHRLLGAKGLHVFGTISRDARPVLVPDAHGTVEIHALPYCEPAEVREVLGRDELRDHDGAMAARVEALARSRDGRKRAIAVAHAFVAGGSASESERPLAIGGSCQVRAEVFAGFQYAALGHLHRRQELCGGTVRYSGSLLKYSWSEWNHEKSVNLVEIDAAGKAKVEAVPIAARRDLRWIEGTLDRVLEGPKPGESRNDYLAIRLLDRGPLFDAMGRLREVYPNVLHVEQPAPEPSGEEARAGGERLVLTQADLFAAFWQRVTGGPLDEGESEALARTIDSLGREDREAST